MEQSVFAIYTLAHDNLFSSMKPSSKNRKKKKDFN